MKRLPLPTAPAKVDPAQEAYFYRKGWNACADDMARTERALESLCQWLLHRFGPDSPEGLEASARLAPLYPAPPAAQWISVKERLPERNQDVIIALTTGTVLCGFYNGKSMGWYWEETDIDEDADAAVTHWLQMPAAPQSMRAPVSVYTEDIAKAPQIIGGGSGGYGK